MFAGKTETLIKYIDSAIESGKSIKCYKHALDNRYIDEDASTPMITSHNKNMRKCVPASNIAGIINETDGDTDMIFIDEGQFFDDLDTCKLLVSAGIHVYIAALDMTYERKWFPATKRVYRIANTVIKIRSTCSVCGIPARYTGKRDINADCVSDDSVPIQIGGIETYYPTCESH